jgi:hypothetical protein
LYKDVQRGLFLQPLENSNLLPNGLSSDSLILRHSLASCPLRRNLGDVADPREPQLVHLNRQLEEIVEAFEGKKNNIISTSSPQVRNPTVVH